MEDEPSPIDRMIVELGGPSRPRVCFIATPSGDSLETIEKFYGAYELLDCEPSHLAFFRKPLRASLPLEGYAEHLLKQDAIFVGGGNTKSALGVWREWGLDGVLREAWSRGILLSGMSAGALCWFTHGLTDSYWGGGLKTMECLGFLPGGCCVHYSSEPERRRRLHEELVAGAVQSVVAIDDGAAVLFAGTDIVRAICWRATANAYRVSCSGTLVREVSLEPHSIG